MATSDKTSKKRSGWKIKTTLNQAANMNEVSAADQIRKERQQDDEGGRP
jgi:hypothetical protein